MELKDILVCLDPTDAGAARLRLAAALASRHRAHLSAAYIMPDETPDAEDDGLGFHAPAESAAVARGSLVGGLPIPAAMPSLKGDYRRRLESSDDVKQRFREVLQPEAVAGDWHLFGSGQGGDLISLARGADLVIYGQASPEDRLPRGFGPDDIILAAGRPMLLVPYAGADFAGLGRRAVVAWDGSREAARAAHDALLVLGQAELVSLLAVGDSQADLDRHRPGLDPVLKNFERHGIRARVEQALRGDLSVSDLLLSRAADLGADLIVAGAYHHSQLRESVFGGVTRDLLDRMTVPVLMSH